MTNTPTIPDTATAKPVLHQPDFATAVRELLGGDPAATGGPQVLQLAYPTRAAAPEIQRACMQAVLLQSRVAIVYFSVTSGQATEREIAPQAFGHDGFRWHVRAWCYRHQDYRDFVLSRITSAVVGEVLPEALPPDVAWTTEVEVTARLNPALPEAVKAGLREDYDLDAADALHWHTREALAFYARKHLDALASPGAHGLLVPWFVEAT